jgi:hypothetical protein
VNEEVLAQWGAAATKITKKVRNLAQRRRSNFNFRSSRCFSDGLERQILYERLGEKHAVGKTVNRENLFSCELEADSPQSFSVFIDLS